MCVLDVILARTMHESNDVEYDRKYEHAHAQWRRKFGSGHKLYFSPFLYCRDGKALISDSRTRYHEYRPLPSSTAKIWLGLV